MDNLFSLSHRFSLHLCSLKEALCRHSSVLRQSLPSSKMSTLKEDKGKSKHFRWTKPMSHMLLEILADEAKKGNKPSSTFKPDSLARVAREINLKFGVECAPDHVENHLKTIKKEWKIIMQLKERSGFGWDDNMKMITVTKQVYDEEIMAHPHHEKYLNKKIEMYSEMALVVGKDVATGYFAKSFNDINTDEPIELKDDDISLTKETSSSSIGGGKRSHRKRARESEDPNISILAAEIKEVAVALRQLSKSQVDVDVLREEVMKTEGFDDSTLDSIFDYLVLNEKIARAFLAKNTHFRQVWIQKFINEHGA